jgi:23S rRNA (cytosine1962-C5)-methyltransferase
MTQQQTPIQPPLVLTQPGTDACRWLHGRGQCIAGWENINIEWLPPIALVVAYSPLSDAQNAALLEGLKVYPEVKGALQQQRDLPGAPIHLLFGEPAAPDVITERGLNYRLQLGDKQNFGIFLDMAAGRQWVREHANEKRVLNLFSYTCAFAVAALAGGADEVVNLDMSKAALGVGRENLKLNDLNVARAKFLGHDLFKSWGKVKRMGPYDLVIIDPPSLQKGSLNVEKDYPRILRQLPAILAKQGTAMLCLNAPKLPIRFLTDAVAAHCPALQLVEVLERSENLLEHTPDDGLKVLIYKLAAEPS